jgi:phenolic acid decarboxylase
MCYKNDRLAILLYEYMRRMDVKLDNEVIQLYNNIQYRQADPVDHLEMIMAQTRKQMANEIFADLYRIIAIVRNQ